MRNRYFEDEAIKNGMTAKHFKRLFTYLKPYKSQMLVAVVVILGTGILSSLVPYLLKVAFDDALPDKNLIKIISIAIGIIVIVICNIQLFKVRVNLVTKIGQNAISEIRKDVFLHLQKLPFRYYDERPHGKIIVRVVNYINAISDLLSQGIIDVLADLVGLIMVLLFMFSIHFKLALLCVLITPLTFSLVLYVRKKFHKELQILNNKQSNMNAYIHESISGLKITQSFVREEENIDILEGLMYDYKNQFMRSKRMKFLAGPIVKLSEALVMIMILYVGANWIELETITLGILVAFLSYMGQFWNPMSKISDFYAQLATALSYLERIFEIMEEKPEIADTKEASPVEKIDGKIEFKDVTFSYEEGIEIIENMNLHVRAGETVAIVGPTGSGKSTIIHLISRFYNIDSGLIRIDNIPLEDITLQSLRSHMGIMQQDTFIFSTTVYENIRYGKLDATDQEVQEAAKAVCAHKFIIEMEQGYDTQVHENGSRLSVGQRQLIGLARIFLSNPSIIILDEATSSIDTETEREIQKGLTELFKGRTTIVIAHRLSTIRNADRILYINKGKIVEEGSHDKLIMNKGHYWHLYSTQMKYLE